MENQGFNNPGSNSNSDSRRTGGSANDPHGGHNHTNERHSANPDPINEFVPAGDGALAPTKQIASEDAELLAFTESQKPNLLDEMAAVDGTGTLDPRAQPGFGPTELDGPQFEGNPELGIDPNDIGNNMPPRDS